MSRKRPTVTIRWNQDEEYFVAEAAEPPGCKAYGRTAELALKRINRQIDRELGQRARFTLPAWAVVAFLAIAAFIGIGVLGGVIESRRPFPYEEAEFSKTFRLSNKTGRAYLVRPVRFSPANETPFADGAALRYYALRAGDSISFGLPVDHGADRWAYALLLLEWKKSYDPCLINKGHAIDSVCVGGDPPKLLGYQYVNFGSDSIFSSWEGEVGDESWTMLPDGAADAPTPNSSP